MKYKWPLISIAAASLLAPVWGDGSQAAWGKKNQPMTASQETPPAPAKRKERIKPILEAKAGYFFFSDSKMRKIYDKGGLDVQLSGSYPIWEWLQAYGSVEYLSRHGKSLGTGQNVRIWEVPLSLGLKPVVKITQCVHYYFTIGPRYFFVHAHNNSRFVDRKLNQNGLGGFVNTGFNFFPMPHFCIDIFGEYSYNKMRFHPHKPNVFSNEVQVGGYCFGGGLGYAF